MLDSLDLPFVQRALADVLLLSVAAGLLGTWIVLRGLAFFAHAAGTAAFPGLVLADGIGLAAPAGAFAAALAFAFGVERLGRGRGGYDVLTAIVLVAGLAAGVVLASDVYASGARVDSLLFGSLLLVDGADIALAAATAALALAGTALLGRRWLATGFDPAAARSLGARPAAADAALLVLVALTATAALAGVGALLASAMLVVPAATARLWSDRMPVWQASATALAAVEGTVALLVSVELNAPPGATLAVLGGAVFALVAAVRALAEHRRLRAAAVVAALAACAVLAAGCGAGAAAGAGGRVSVVATTTIVADWARAVGGRRVDVHAILQPNTDPHEYEPRPADVVAAARADLVLSSGGEVDGWIGDILEAGGADAPHLVLGDSVPVRLPLGDGHDDDGEGHSGELDPHWWQDPRDAAAAVRRIGAALVAVDPAGAPAYRRRAAAYVARLRRLDTAIAGCFERIPPDRRKLVTDHDAFAYLAHRYGITLIGAVIPAATTAAEPSAGDAAALLSRIRAERVPAVFPERSVDPELAETIARETGATVGGVLYSDALGPAGSPAATYLGMAAANADAIVRGLTGGRAGCDADGAG